MTEANIKYPPKPVLGVAEPQLFVSDIRTSCDFYREKLGFHARFVYGEPPFYAQVVRDAARLNLRHLDSPIVDAHLRAGEDLLSATIVLDDPEALFQEYQAKRVPFHQLLKTEAWGSRSFIVADPDGNLIAFSGGR
jgi:catechol 2,3-dioxygenase-like lactoylglutathione lyase family enzyme